MRQYLLPVLVIAMLNVVPVQICRRRLGEALPATLFCVPVALFASRFLFHTFVMGIFVSYGTKRHQPSNTRNDGGVGSTLPRDGLRIARLTPSLPFSNSVDKPSTIY